MKVIENATVIGHSYGDKNIVIVKDELTGNTVRFENNTGIEMELGLEGMMSYNEQMQVVNFETVMQEELA